MSEPNRCCAGRPDCYEGKAIGDIPDLAVLLEAPGVDSREALYKLRRCRNCGQWWELGVSDHYDGEAYWVQKWFFPPVPGAPVPSRFSPPLSVFVGWAVGLAAGLATMPPLAEGVGARRMWVLGALFFGMLGALGVKGLLCVADRLRERLRSKS